MITQAQPKLKHFLHGVYSGGTPTAGSDAFYAIDGSGTPFVNIADMSLGFPVTATQKHLTDEGLEDKRLKILPRGTILLSMYATIGLPNRLEVEAAISQAIIALFPSKSLDRHFLYYWLLHLRPMFLADVSGSTQGNLNAEKVKNAPFIDTDLPTQKRIASFLDRETERIDELTEKKQLFADLILAREEASFLAAVTGKDVSGPKHHSGVDWIGDLPEEWLAPKFTMVARQETGHTPSRKEPSYWVPEDCVIPWLSLADVWQLRSGEAVYLSDTSEKISEFGMANSSARLLPEDTVVLSRTASVGFAAIMSCPMATTQDYAAWTCGPTIRPKFLYYVLRAMKPEFRRLMMGSTHQTIYMPDIRAFRTPLPPLEEQDQITNGLDASIGTYRQAHKSIATSIQKLREYRAALITAAVTGQIDVDTYGKSGATSATLDKIEEEMQA